MGLISRQAAIDALKKQQAYFSKEDSPLVYYEYRRAIEAIEWLPQVGAVEVVRCQECKWKQGSECVRFADVRPFPNDFCSRGEE